MNYRLTCCTFLTLTLTLFASVFAFAQGSKSPGRGTTGTTSPSTTGNIPMQPTMNIPDSTVGRRAFISGKVVLDDGSQLTEAATIQTVCQGHRQTVAHTDSHGGFTFEFGDRMAAAAAGISSADVDSSYSPGGSVAGSQRDWRSCELQAELSGFT